VIEDYAVTEEHAEWGEATETIDELDEGDGDGDGEDTGWADGELATDVPDTPGVQAVADVADVAEVTGEAQPEGGTGHPAVDAAIQAVVNAEQLPVAEQLAAYEGAHQTLREVLASIED